MLFRQMMKTHMKHTPMLSWIRELERPVTTQPRHRQPQIPRLKEPCLRKLRTSIPKNLAMPNLSQKPMQLKQAEEVKIKTEEADTMTMDELAKETVDFGKNKGKTYKEAFNDTSWVTYMVGRQGTLTGPSHLKFYKYVEFRVDQGLAEANFTEKDSKFEKPKTKTKVTTKKAAASDSWEEAEMVKPVDEDSPVYEIFDQIDVMRTEYKMIRQQVELQQATLGEIIDHLRRGEVKIEHHN